MDVDDVIDDGRPVFFEKFSVAGGSNSAIEIRASLGHEKNQSMEVLEMRPAKFLHLILSQCVAGCKLSFERPKKLFYKKFNDFVKSLKYFAIF